MIARTKWLTGGVFVLLLFGVLVAVGPRRPSLSGQPGADLSSPEQALKSYWKVHDWMRRSQSGEVKPGEPRIDPDELLRQVTSTSVHSSFGQRPMSTARLAWSIESIETPSTGRAIALVRIRNLDRNPAVITPTPVELFDRSESAGLYRYVMSYQDQQWKIVEVWRLEGDGAARRLR